MELEIGSVVNLNRLHSYTKQTHGRLTILTDEEGRHYFCHPVTDNHVRIYNISGLEEGAE